MSKTSKKETSQEIDPQLAANSEANMGLARMLISQLGVHNPYKGNDIAAFAAQQLAAFQNIEGASDAFGMAYGGMPSMPEPTMDENGILGYSTHDLMRNEVGEEEYLRVGDFLQRFQEKAGEKPKAKKKKSGGGKK